MKALKTAAVALGIVALGAVAVACGETEKPTPTTYRVTFVQNGFEDVVMEIVQGGSIAESAMPIPQAKTGYTVVWEAKDLSSINENLTVNAVATPNDYQITYQAGDGIIDTATQMVTYDAPYTLATPTLDGYDFVCWLNGEVAFAQEGVWKTDANVTLTAKYEEILPQFCTVTFVQAGQTPIEKTVAYGEALTDIPMPQAKTGYTVAWQEVDLTGITTNLTVNAVETPMQVTIRYLAAGGTMQSSVQTVRYDEDVVAFTATKKGETFVGWFVADADGNATQTKYVGGVWNRLEDLTLVAVWEEDMSSNEHYTERF